MAFPIPRSACFGSLVLLLAATASAIPGGVPSLSSTSTGSTGDPTATIDAGVVIGTTTSFPTATAPVHQFLGVPFAKSPPTRFAPPESPEPFGQPIEAKKWSPACIQQFVYPKLAQEFAEDIFNNPRPEESEDCLYLNVYAPSTPAPADGRAVMYWIYGGSLQFGTAGMPSYDGSSFAANQDVVVVTVNYRTNVFGFPGSPELPLDKHNLGFLDQRMGLDWVQRNIHAFGGSPEKVTIFGESAGAWSVDALLTSFPAGSSPPFRAAIAQSGTISYNVVLNATTSAISWNNLTAALDCPGSFNSTLTCVSAAPATKIKTIIEERILEFNPIPDNITLVSDPAARRTSGNIAPIPVLGGTNSQEGRVFTVGTKNTSQYLSTTFHATPAEIAGLEAAYPLGSPGIANAYDQSAQIFTELVFQCPQAFWANATAQRGIPTWRYYFNASFANTQPYPGLGVFHSSEIPIVYATYPPHNSSTQQFALSRSMQAAWAAFAKNPLAGPGWNRVDSGAAGAVLLGADASVPGGLYGNAAGNGSDAYFGSFDLAVWGNRGDVMTAGVTVVDQSEVDARCALYKGLYGVL